MKIKQYLVITDPLEFATGNYSNCFNLFDYPSGGGGWIDCGELEIEVNSDKTEAVEISMQALDHEISEAKIEMTNKITLLETKRQELLCLTCD